MNIKTAVKTHWQAFVEEMKKPAYLPPDLKIGDRVIVTPNIHYPPGAPLEPPFEATVESASRPHLPYPTVEYVVRRADGTTRNASESIVRAIGTPDPSLLATEKKWVAKQEKATAKLETATQEVKTTAHASSAREQKSAKSHFEKAQKRYDSISQRLDELREDIAASKTPPSGS
jgi:hypothetical protein